MSILETATDRVERILEIVPADHELAELLRDHLSSLQFSSPENAPLHVNRVVETLSKLGDPAKLSGWARQVFDIWMETP